MSQFNEKVYFDIEEILLRSEPHTFQTSQKVLNTFFNLSTIVAVEGFPFEKVVFKKEELIDIGTTIFEQAICMKDKDAFLTLSYNQADSANRLIRSFMELQSDDWIDGDLAGTFIAFNLDLMNGGYLSPIFQEYLEQMQGGV